MLSTLSIRNYAIIDELEITFSGKMNVLTGETGAGKSIIVGALGLILGQRADSSSLVNKEQKSIIEGRFKFGQRSVVSKFLKENDLDSDDDLVVRREIAVNGKSRAFINDTPVTLQQLQELSAKLVDLHQQFDTSEVAQADFQLQVIDSLAGTTDALAAYQETFRLLFICRKNLRELENRKKVADQEADYHRFQFTELEELSLQPDELESLESELVMLSHAESIQSALEKTAYELSESEQPIAQQIKILCNQLSGFQHLHAEIPALLSRLQSSQIELQDIAGDVSRLAHSVTSNPQRAAQLQERLNRGYKLQKKHGVKTTNELIALQKEFGGRLEQLLNLDEEIINQKAEEKKLTTVAAKQATAISAARAKAIKPFEDKVNKLLKQVGMPNARLRVDIRTIELNDTGIDDIEFMFDANLSAAAKGAEQRSNYQPLKKVASGGELSRLMLCIKSLVAESMDLPTMIFDEIDTGISGEAAKQVGMIMQQLSAKRQVICITHQPQIAGRGDAHFFVHKENRRNGIHTGIRKLGNEERIKAIAQMLSGEQPTAAALEIAKEMIG